MQECFVLRPRRPRPAFVQTQALVERASAVIFLELRIRARKNVYNVNILCIMASFVGASELYDEHSKYASDFREALDHFEAGRVCEAADVS